MVSASYEEHVLNAPGDHAALARDVLNVEGKIVKYWAGFADNASAVRFYLSQPRETRHWYEILRATRPICVGLDVDFKLGDPAPPDHASVMERLQLRATDSPDAFLAAVLARLFAALPVLGDSPRYVSSSHRPGRKVSFHIKFPAYTLPDMAARTLFRAVLSKGALADLAPCVDPTVYDTNKAIRLLYSCKLDDPTRVLIPTEAGAAFDVETVLRHMWTEVPLDAVPLPSSALLALLPDGWEARNNKRKARADDGPPGAQASEELEERAPREECAPREELAPCEARHVELVAAAIGDLSAWSAPDARTWKQPTWKPPTQGGALVLYWKADADYRCIHGLTHKSNNFITFEGADGLIMSRCLSARCEQLGATRALGAALLVEGPPAIRRAGDVAWREFPGATDAWRQPWTPPDEQTAYPAPWNDEEALMSRFGLRVHRYNGESGPAAGSLHQWEFYSHSTCPVKDCGKVHPAPYRVKLSATSSFARPVLYAQCANETGSRGLALYPSQPRVPSESIWMAAPADCHEFDRRVTAVFRAPDWAAKVRETLELLAWSAGGGDYYTRVRKTRDGVSYTYADVAERVAYDGEGGFRMGCRSVIPGGKGFDVRPKRHAAQRLSAAAAAAMGGGFAVGPE